MVSERSNREAIVSPEEPGHNPWGDEGNGVLLLPSSPQLLAHMNPAIQEIADSAESSPDNGLAQTCVIETGEPPSAPESSEIVAGEDTGEGLSQSPSTPFEQAEQAEGENHQCSGEEFSSSFSIIPLEMVADDFLFRLRPEGDIDSLATSIAKHGQLFPIDLREIEDSRYHVVTGFRRIAALRLLKREYVSARVHHELSEVDAFCMAFGDSLEHREVEHEELKKMRDRLLAEGRLIPSLQEALDRAIAPVQEELESETVPGAEEEEEEVDLDELAKDVIKRLAAVNQDLALVMELWNAMDPDVRDTLFEQLSYSEQLVKYLRSG